MLDLPSLSSLSSLAKSTVAQIPSVAKPSAAAEPPEVTAEITQKCFLLAQNKQPIGEEMYGKLKYYFKYASTAYLMTPLTPGFLRPNGQTVVQKLYDLLTDTNGYIVRNDTNKEIVVVFRGSVSPVNFAFDAMAVLVDFDPLRSDLRKDVQGVQVHMGFQKSWNTVASTVLSVVADEHKENPTYKIVVVGHSLGGAIASLAAVTLSLTYEDVHMYTYGQPRTGNYAYAALADKQLGNRIHRVVHSFDGVPTMVFQALGYRHHGTEYWTFCFNSTKHTFQFAAPPGEENPEGSASVPSMGIDISHLWYFGILSGTPFWSLG